MALARFGIMEKLRKAKPGESPYKVQCAGQKKKIIYINGITYTR